MSKPTYPSYAIYKGDTLDIMKRMPTDSVDLVFCSPPYEAARKYGELDFKLKGQEWVDWAVERYIECCRVSRGLAGRLLDGREWNEFPQLEVPA